MYNKCMSEIKPPETSGLRPPGYGPDGTSLFYAYNDFHTSIIETG
jgi:hypothetical protein